MTDDSFALVMIGIAILGVATGFFLSRWLRLREARRLRAELEAQLVAQRDALRRGRD